MASMRDIKRRKESIQSTSQITKAMKLVSTVKLQKAKGRAEETQLLCGRERQPPCQEPVRFLDSRTDHHGESRSHHLHRDRQL